MDGCSHTRAASLPFLLRASPISEAHSATRPFPPSPPPPPGLTGFKKRRYVRGVLRSLIQRVSCAHGRGSSRLGQARASDALPRLGLFGGGGVDQRPVIVSSQHPSSSDKNLLLPPFWPEKRGKSWRPVGGAPELWDVRRRRRMGVMMSEGGGREEEESRGRRATPIQKCGGGVYVGGISWDSVPGAVGLVQCAPQQRVSAMRGSWTRLCLHYYPFIVDKIQESEKMTSPSLPHLAMMMMLRARAFVPQTSPSPRAGPLPPPCGRARKTHRERVSKFTFNSVLVCT